MTQRAVIVMYHYVRDDDRMHAFAPERFRAQLQWLGERYRFVGLPEAIAHPHEAVCTLTFDDGLRDGFVNALPIMEEHGAVGAFFVPTCTLVARRVVPAQKRALLLASLGADAVVADYNRLVPEEYQIDEARSFDEYNEPRVSTLKHLLDHIEFAVSDRVIDEMFAAHFDEEAVFEDLYLSKDQLIELDRRGHVVGSHGHDHRWLGNLYAEDQRRDLATSIAHLSDLLGHHPRYISYPFGSRNEVTVRLARHLGFDGALLDPTSAVSEPNPWETNRVDCVDITEAGLPDALARKTRTLA